MSGYGQTWSQALRSDLLEVHGSAQVCRTLPRWLKLSAFAAIPRPA